MFWPTDLLTWMKVAEGGITSLGILLAGIWSYYTFVRGRTFAPNVEIKTTLKSVQKYAQYNALIFTVSIKNSGRTKVLKKRCDVEISPIIIGDPEIKIADFAAKRPIRLDVFRNSVQIKPYILFEEVSWLEPNESAVDELLLAVKSERLFKVTVRFVSKKGVWISSAIIDFDSEDKLQRHKETSLWGS